MSNPVLLVQDVFNDVGRVLGISDPATIYSRLNDIVEILSTESDWDATRGYVDVCVGCNGQVTLPPEVDVVLAVNINGRPTQMHDFWFQFHLNGPGEYFREADTGWQWTTPSGRGDGGNKSSHTFDGLYVSVYQDPPPGGCSLVTQLETPADSGTPCRVYGFDPAGNWLREFENNVPVDGILIPTVYGNPQTNAANTQFGTITGVSFGGLIRQGYIGLWAVDAQGNQTQLGNYAPTEYLPKYRRIQLSRPCGIARIAFKRRVQLLQNMTDLIFLPSKYAIVTMALALKKYDDDRVQEGELYQNKAVNFLIKKQKSISVPAGPSIQYADNNLIADKQDRME
jgi:hypothetical protein